MIASNSVDQKNAIGTHLAPDVCPVKQNIETPAVSVSNVSKTYPNGKKALEDVSFSVDEGQIFGLLGPNGAGKSTLIKILCGVIAPSSGIARVFGVDTATHPRAAKEQVCGLLQGAPIESNMRVGEVVTLFSRFYKTPIDTEDLLASLGLTELRFRLCRTLSGGQRQRLAIARALVGNPRVLVLDEPSTGLDVAARHHLMQMIRELRGSGRTIIISTHNIDEAEVLCDQVAIVSRGRLFAVDSPERLIRQNGSNTQVSIVVNQALSIDSLKRLPAVEEVKVIPAQHEGSFGYVIGGASTDEILTQLLGILAASNIMLDSLSVIKSGLEAAYLRLTGERITS